MGNLLFKEGNVVKHFYRVFVKPEMYITQHPTEPIWENENAIGSDATSGLYGLGSSGNSTGLYKELYECYYSQVGSCNAEPKIKTDDVGGEVNQDGFVVGAYKKVLVEFTLIDLDGQIVAEHLIGGGNYHSAIRLTNSTVNIVFLEEKTGVVKVLNGVSASSNIKITGNSYDSVDIKGKREAKKLTDLVSRYLYSHTIPDKLKLKTPIGSPAEPLTEATVDWTFSGKEDDELTLSYYNGDEWTVVASGISAKEEEYTFTIPMDIGDSREYKIETTAKELVDTYKFDIDSYLGIPVALEEDLELRVFSEEGAAKNKTTNIYETIDAIGDETREVLLGGGYQFTGIEYLRGTNFIFPSTGLVKFEFISPPRADFGACIIETNTANSGYDDVFNIMIGKTGSSGDYLNASISVGQSVAGSGTWRCHLIDGANKYNDSISHKVEMLLDGANSYIKVDGIDILGDMIFAKGDVSLMAFPVYGNYVNTGKRFYTDACNLIGDLVSLSFENSFAYDFSEGDGLLALDSSMNNFHSTIVNPTLPDFHIEDIRFLNKQNTDGYSEYPILTSPINE